MEWQELVLELVEFVKSSSNVLWVIAQRQTAMECIQYFISLVTAIIIFAWSLKWTKCLWSKVKGKDILDADTFHVLGITGTSVVCAISFFLIPTYVCQIIARFINPDYYAIKVLIDLIR